MSSSWSTKDTIKTINHYKRSLEAQDVDAKRILHCLSVLFKLRVSVQTLQETGIGRTVNGLCKSENGEEVRSAARALVNKWKELVVNESEDEPGRRSQEEEQNKQHQHNQRKDSEKIKRERDHRSSYHHQKHKTSSSSSKDAESKGAKAKPPSDHDLHSSNERAHKEHHHSKKSKSGKSGSESRKRSAEEKIKESGSSSSKRHRSETGSSSNGSRSKPRDGKQVKKSEEDDIEIDGSAGTSFADALAMMDGPSTPMKNPKGTASSTNKSTSSSTASKTAQSNDRHESLSKSKGNNRRPSESQASTSGPSGSGSKAVPGSSRPSDAGSGPPKLLAPTMKLAPLLDPEEMKKDILGPSVVISNSYTPTSYLNAAIQRNKRPVGQPPPPAADSNNFEILQSKARTKVYSGNKGAATVLSLHEMCIRILQKNVDALEYTGGVPFDILEPILLKCTPSQLDQIEYYNPYLSEDTNDLWKMHVTRQFRGKKRQEMESWREMFQRCLQEEQERLSHLTESIKHSQQTSLPVKQTKLAYMDVKAPPMGRRRVAGAGGGAGPSISASLANRTTVNGTRMGYLTAGREVQAKRAPLMQKTLALMKKSIKR